MGQIVGLSLISPTPIFFLSVSKLETGNCSAILSNRSYNEVMIRREISLDNMRDALKRV